MSSRYRRIGEGGRGAIAQGSFGKVYVAHDKQTGECVAVKRQELPSTAAARELSMFRALSQEPHPHVMTLLNHFECRGDCGRSFLYMVFPFMDQSLQKFWVNRRGLLHLNLGRRLLRHAVLGVAHLHARDVLHGDLSMANLLVGADAGCEPGAGAGFEPLVLKIGDLGGAACASSCVLGPAEQMGTQYIRAPEVILGCRSPLPSVDLWALGVVGVALLAGTSLFWPFPHERGDAPDGELETLARQARFLGPMPPKPWAGFEPASLTVAQSQALSGQEAAHATPSYSTPALYLEDADLVQQPLHRTSDASRLLLRWLRWVPTERLAAQHAARHCFLQERASTEDGDNDPILELQVKQAATDVLRALVLQSIREGAPVTRRILADAIQAQSQATPPANAAADAAASRTQPTDPETPGLDLALSQGRALTALSSTVCEPSEAREAPLVQAATGATGASAAAARADSGAAGAAKAAGAKVDAAPAEDVGGEREGEIHCDV